LGAQNQKSFDILLQFQCYWFGRVLYFARYVLTPELMDRDQPGGRLSFLCRLWLNSRKKSIEIPPPLPYFYRGQKSQILTQISIPLLEDFFGNLNKTCQVPIVGVPHSTNRVGEIRWRKGDPKMVPKEQNG